MGSGEQEAHPHSQPTDRRPSERETSVVLDDLASVTLQTAIADLGRRQQVTANNIANIETPNFTASSVSFESSLAAAVNAGNPAAAQVSTDPTTDAPGVNGNNVSLDNEFVTATKTTLQEQLLTQALTSHYAELSTALKAS
jgi:flagellar basal-body rod protein FlgB